MAVAAWSLTDNGWGEPVMLHASVEAIRIVTARIAFDRYFMDDCLLNFLVSTSTNAEELKFPCFVAEKFTECILVRFIQADDFILFIE